MTTEDNTTGSTSAADQKARNGTNQTNVATTKRTGAEKQQDAKVALTGTITALPELKDGYLLDESGSPLVTQ
jgi:hypothetical protein